MKLATCHRAIARATSCISGRTAMRRGITRISWTQMLDDDASQWFQDHGGLTRANGDRFRAMVLSRGNTEDLAKMYEAWLGREPTVAPMLKDLGLVDDGK